MTIAELAETAPLRTQNLPMRILQAVKRVLLASEGRHSLLIFVVTLLVFLPALFAGFAIDDHVFRALFQGLPGIEGLTFNPLDTFLFGDGIPDHSLARMNKGLAPWWSPLDWKIGFWRPLSSWSHWLDFRLYGDHAFMMHLESVLLYALIGLSLYCLYRKTLTPAWVAALAALLYVVDDGHGVPVAWISNRNTVLSTLFVVLTLLFHDRWRRGGTWRHWATALACLILGLLSGEATLAVGGYLFAHALFLDTGSYPRRIARLLPYLAIVVAWRVVYSHLGYGIVKAGIYTDPGAQPLQFLVDVAQFVPVLLLSQFALPDPAMVWMFAPPLGQALFWLAAVAFVGLLLWGLGPILHADKAARFWALGMILSLIPACATMPQARLLMAPGLGAMALIALLLQRWLEGIDRRKVTAILAYGFIALHLILAPIMLLGTPSGMKTMERVFRESNASLDMIPNLDAKHLVVLNSVSDLNAIGIPLMRSSFCLPVPKLTTVLYTGIGDVRVERIFVDPREVTYAPGDRVELNGVTAEILDVLPDGRPAAVRFTFDHRLEDPSLAFVRWEKGRYVAADVPNVGGKSIARGTSMVSLVVDAMEP